MKNRILIFSSSLFLLFGCGGGGGGTTPMAPFENNQIIVSMTVSDSEVEVGQTVVISHTVSNAVPTSCSIW